MRKTLLFGLLVGLLAFSAATEARIRMNVEGLESFYKYSDVQSSLGYKLGVEYQLDTLPLFAGLNYLDTGFHEIDGSGGAAIIVRGLNTSVGYALPLNRFFDENTSAWVKAGYYIADAKGRATTGDISRNTQGFSYGVGADCMVKPWLGLRVGFEQLVAVKDFQSSADSTSNLSLFSFGVFFTEPSATPAPVRDAPSPEVRAPASTSQVFPSAATPAAPLSNTATRARVVRPVGLRGRPTADAEAPQRLNAGTLVDVTAPLMHNEVGNWYYVTAGEMKGWLLDSELDFSSP